LIEVAAAREGAVAAGGVSTGAAAVGLQGSNSSSGVRIVEEGRAAVHTMAGWRNDVGVGSDGLEVVQVEVPVTVERRGRVAGAGGARWQRGASLMMMMMLVTSLAGDTTCRVAVTGTLLSVAWSSIGS